jgi:hypothetical protein
MNLEAWELRLIDAAFDFWRPRRDAAGRWEWGDGFWCLVDRRGGRGVVWRARTKRELVEEAARLLRAELEAERQRRDAERAERAERRRRKWERQRRRFRRQWYRQRGECLEQSHLF